MSGPTGAWDEARPGVLVHLASGIGNVVLATPLLIALDELGFAVHVRLDADYPETADLLRDWSVVRGFEKGTLAAVAGRFAHLVPAVPPFYWRRFARQYRGRSQMLARPPDAEFYRDEQAYYLSFARALGYPPDHRPNYCLPIGPPSDVGPPERRVVLAPGCKTGIMAAKRWPHFPELAARLEDVTVVGTGDDLRTANGGRLRFPPHCRLLVDRLGLRETAEVMAGAAVVVANDSGLAHVAAAVGTPTLMLFGPTPHLALGPLPPNVRVLRAGLPCEPCWLGDRLAACHRRVDCLASLSVEAVSAAVGDLLEGHGAGRPGEAA